MTAVVAVFSGSRDLRVDSLSILSSIALFKNRLCPPLVWQN